MLRQLKVFFLLWLFASPSQALGCAVCGFGDGESRDAFILTTGLLTFVPLIFIGSVIFYMWRRFRKLRAAEGFAADE